MKKLISIYKKEFVFLIILLVACVGTVFFIKHTFFSNVNSLSSLDKITGNENDSSSSNSKPKLASATTIPNTTTVYNIFTTSVSNEELDLIESESNEDVNNSSYPYINAPEFSDDGSIIYDGMTITELTNKLNRSLGDYLTNTGYFFAEYTKNTGLDPYLSVAIVLLETGCQWKCSTLTRECFNIGGLKGYGSCRGTSYSKYDSLEDGIDGYLDIIYNNYYLKGMRDANSMASTYAASSEWANKVNAYIELIKSK